MVDRNILVAKVTTIEKCLNKVKEKRSSSLELFTAEEFISVMVRRFA